MTAIECCELLPWDSQHFGVRIGRVGGGRLTEALVAEIEEWGRLHKVDCLYFLADPEPVTMHLAAAAGFRFVDIRTTWELKIECSRPAVASPPVRLASIEDIPELRRIAGESHEDSRFYRDGNFSREACDEMYRIWIERSCLEPGFADAVLVAEREGHVAGYISCRKEAAAGEIGLVAVACNFRGMGLGSCLVQQACEWFATQGTEHATVVTQGFNVPAQRLYQQAGFQISSARPWYHRWFLNS